MKIYTARTVPLMLCTLLSLAGCGDDEKKARQFLADQGCTAQEITDKDGGRFSFKATCEGGRECQGSIIVKGDSISNTMDCRSRGANKEDSAGNSGDPATTPAKVAEACSSAANCAQVAKAARVAPAVGADWKFAVEANLLGCRAGDANQCAQAGHAFRNGYGIEGDIKLAGKLLKKACDGGHAASCGWHAVLLIDDKDGQGALKVGRENCVKKIGMACGSVGLVLLEGIGGVDVKMDAGIANLKMGCELKDAWSCTTLGNLMNSKDVGPFDLVRAGKAYREGCLLGNGGACEMLEASADNYRKDGTGQDFKVAAGYRKDLCEVGHPASCAEYGYYLRNGEGVAKNEADALLYSTMACKWGNAVGCANQGDMDLTAGKPDAIENLARACYGGVRFACNRLLKNSTTTTAAEKSELVRNALEMACGDVESDLVACRKMCKSSGLTCEHMDSRYPEGSPKISSISADFVRHLNARCAKSIGWACDDLGYQHRTGQHGFKKDRSKGLALLQKACELGDQDSCFNLADNLDDDPKTYDEAIKLLESTCLAGHATACGSLGMSLVDTKKEPIDVKRGLTLLLQRCDLNDGSVGYCEAAGNLLLHGTPKIPADVRAAFVAFRKGCISGNRTACSALRDRHHRPFPLVGGAKDDLPFDL